MNKKSRSLDPCKFCGEKREHMYHRPNGWQYELEGKDTMYLVCIKCKTCGAQGSMMTTDAAARSYWNGEYV